MTRLVRRIGRGGAGAVALATVVLAGCAPQLPPIRYVEPANATSDGLIQVHANTIGAVFVRPGSSLSGYESAAVLPFTVEYANPPQDVSPLRRERQNLELGPEGLARLKGLCRHEIQRAVDEVGRFERAQAPAPGALVVRGHIAQLEINRLPSPHGGDEVARSTGWMLGIIDFQDSQTGETLFRIADRRAIQPAGERAFDVNWVNTFGGMRTVCQIWSRAVSLWLGGLHELEAIPDQPQQPVAAAH